MDAIHEKEINEAIDAVNNTLSYLNSAKEYLDKSLNWGLWDILGGGFFVTAVKHNNIGKAEKQLNLANKSFDILRKELSDVGEFVELNIDIGDFLALADYFFDGLFADFMVQSKLKDVRAKVFSAIEELEKLLESLNKAKEN